jgi:hypothetical protein
MQDSDTLLTIAQVAAAFAGFSGLIAVLGQERVRVPRAVAAAWLRRMVEFALMVLAFSIIPVVVGRFDVSPPVEWRVVSLAFALVWGAGAWSASRRVRAMRAAGSVGPTLSFVLTTANTAPLLVLLANALGAFGDQSAAVYLACLTYGLLLSGVLFLRLLRAFALEGGAD